MIEHTIRPVIKSVRALDPDLRTGALWELRLPDEFMKKVHHTFVWSDEVASGVRMFFKMYRHRKLPTWWKSKALRFRAEREYDRLNILHQAGVPCSEPMLFACGVSPEHGRYEVLGTREVPYSRKMADFLRDFKDVELRPNLTALFQTIRRMHTAGVYHGTLTPNNIVVSEPPGEPVAFHVIDVPRAIDFPWDLRGTKMAWFDLIHFTYRTAPFIGVDACLPILKEYEFSANHRDRFLRHLMGYRTSKLLRLRLKYEFAVKAWLAKRHGNARLLGPDDH